MTQEINSNFINEEKTKDRGNAILDIYKKKLPEFGVFVQDYYKIVIGNLKNRSVMLQTINTLREIYEERLNGKGVKKVIQIEF